MNFKILITMVVVLLLIGTVAAYEQSITVINIHNTVITINQNNHFGGFVISEDRFMKAQNETLESVKDVYCEANPIQWVSILFSKSSCRW